MKALLAEALLRIRALEAERRGEIAIVGVGLRLPGRPGEPDAADPEAFWRVLVEGVDCARPVPPDRWDAARFAAPDPDEPGTIVAREGSFLEDPRRFDAAFFGIAPREAEAMDPQQALLLKACWRALEHAGVSPDALRGSRTGTFVGIATADWSQELVRRLPDRRLVAATGTGTSPSVAAGRIAYALGLEGPCLAVNTACSSSLVALHLACEALRRRECDAALVCGVNAMLSPATAMVFSNAHMLSRDGRCRTFDAAAEGYGRGEGVVALLCKREEDARRDGDRALACVLGSATNQDGASGGITVPSGRAQQAVIRAALAAARVAPDDVSYVEAHGTGTALGDPIELQALGAVFGGRPADRPLLVGSVKTNLGHTEAAAGLAGVLKVVLQLEHATIAPHLHLARPTPHVDWSGLPLRVPTAPVAWTAGGRRVAGVSSFGFGGSNAHAVIAEPAPADPARDAGGEREREHVLALSARDPLALEALARAWIAHLRAPERAADLAAACATAAHGRARFAHRLAVVGRAPEDLADALERALAGADEPRVARGEAHDRPGARALEAGAPAAEIARAFARGDRVPWESVYDPRLRARVPGYPLRRERTCALLCDADDALAPVALRFVPKAAPPGTPAARYAIEGSGALAEGARAGLAALGASIVGPREPCDALIFAWDAGDAPAQGARGAELLLERVQALAVLAAPPRLIVLARERVGDAALLGFARTAAVEHPELGIARIVVAEADAQEIAAAIVADDGEDEVRLQHGERAVARLRALAPRAAKRMRADGAWIVTGGLGAIGRRIARLLCERGARRVVLVGRGATAAPPQLAELPVEARACDVADPAAVAELVAGLDDLRGVVHAAGVLDDGVIAELTPARLRAVLRPKLDGAWSLHRATERLPGLEHFVLVSSAAALLGSPGQASYVAANLTLDALARARRRAGLPALAIHFGPWAGDGMASGVAVARRLAALGIQPLAPERALAAFETLVCESEDPAPGVFDVDWRAFARALPAGARVRRLEAFLGASADVAEGETGLVAALLAAEPADRAARLEAYVMRVLARVLHAAPEAVDAGRSLAELGLDSLMALEVRNRVQRDLGIVPSIAEVLGARSCAALAGALGERLVESERDGAGSGPSALLDEIEALSEEEVERLLGERPGLEG